MYKTLKRAVKSLIPRSVYFNYEVQLRSLYAVFYSGRKYQCNLCNKKLRRFIPFKEELLCPKCGSSGRARRLWAILNDGFLHEDIKILAFSPARSLYRRMKKSGYAFESSDLSGDFLADKNYNIEDISAAGNTYNLIICYHILEHVENDTAAMKELYRVLRKGGVCFIQTPFKEGKIYENPAITSPEEREKHFGQDDHVRIYSIEGLTRRLKDAGFDVDVREFNSKTSGYFGFRKQETVLICRK